MRIELLPGLTNVIRFPVERRVRPTLDLLREIAPDAREVGSAIEAFGLEDPTVGLRDAVDASTADHIANHVRDEPGRRRQEALAEMLNPLLEQAVIACRDAHDTAVAAAEAQQTLVHAQTTGGYWLEPLETKAEDLTERAVVLLVEAHRRSEEAEGVARAVGIALRGETWKPAGRHETVEELFGIVRSA
jgi:hypothetical protein